MALREGRSNHWGSREGEGAKGETAKFANARARAIGRAGQRKKSAPPSWPSDAEQ